MNRAIFLDRDGVVIEDVNLLTSVDEVNIPERAFSAFRRLNDSEYKLIVVTNQTVVARGLCSESDVKRVHGYITKELSDRTGVVIDGFYYCPHHPQATIVEYRIECTCRKPGSGMLTRAAKEWDLDLRQCWMVGDRMSDINAGAKAGCRTIQVETGAHKAEPIISANYDNKITPDYICDDLLEAVKIIYKNK